MNVAQNVLQDNANHVLQLVKIGFCALSKNEKLLLSNSNSDKLRMTSFFCLVIPSC